MSGKSRNNTEIKVYDRCEELALYIIKTGCTVRQAANHFSVSKSTVHKDVTERLKNINVSYYFEVNEILQKNKSERHIRGGLATKHKYDVMKAKGDFA